MSDGLRACVDWPVRFDAILDHLVAVARPREGGLRGTYGAIYTWLVDKSGEEREAPHCQLVIDRLRSHALREIPFARGARFLDEEVTTSDYVTFPHAASLRELNPEGIAKAARKAGLLTDDDRRLRRIRTERVAHLAPGSETLRQREVDDAATSGYTSDQLISVLGVSGDGFKNLQKAGLLPTAVRSTWIDVWPFDEVKEFLDRCGVNLPLVEQKVGLGPPTSLSTSLVDVVQALLSGSLVPVGTSATGVGLSSVLVAHRDLAALRLKAKADAMTFDQVAAHLRIPKAQLGRLLARKFIRWERGGSGNLRYVRSAELWRFEGAYISLRELRLRFNFPRDVNLREGLDHLGFNPVIKLGKTDVLTWYCREDALAIPADDRKLIIEILRDKNNRARRLRRQGGNVNAEIPLTIK